jgi:hypothetical protein
MTRRRKLPYQLDPTDDYSAKRNRLLGDRLEAVQAAEVEIADEPEHVHWRRRTTRGTVLDYFAANAGVMIEFEIASETAVRLLDLIDLSN